MPLVRIEVIRGQSGEYKNTLLQAVNDVLVDALSTSDDKVIQRLFEFDMEFCQLSPGRTEKFTLIEITMIPGRGATVKRRLIENLTRVLGERLVIKPIDVFIIMNEPPLENWGFRGIQASSEVGIQESKGNL